MLVKYYWDLPCFCLSALQFQPSCSRTQLLSSEMSPKKSSLPVLNTTGSLQEGEMGEMLHGKCLRIVSPEPPAKLYCCYGVIAVLTAAVVALSVALSVKETAQISTINTYAACPENWIGVGNKCYYFSEFSSNWTFSQAFCKAQEAQLARFDNQEELNFLKRCKGNFDYWIGLHRESSAHPWKWTDNTEYNSSVSIRGVETYAYLNDNGISSARVYADRRWSCSKLTSYSLQCKSPFSSM